MRHFLLSLLIVDLMHTVKQMHALKRKGKTLFVTLIMRFVTLGYGAAGSTLQASNT